MNSGIIRALGAITMFALLNGCGEDSPSEPEAPGPELSLLSSNIVLTGDPLLDRLVISNSGEGELSWIVASTPDWILVNQTSGSTWNRSRVTLRTRFDVLSPGQYSGQIKLTSNGGDALVNVALDYKPALLSVYNPLLNLSRDYLHTEMIVSNHGGGELAWRITDKPSWIAVSDSADTTIAVPDTVLAYADLSQLAYGTYKDSIRFESNGGTEEVAIYLTFERAIEVYPGRGAAKVDLGDTYTMIKKVWGEPSSVSYVQEAEDRYIFHIAYDWRGITFEFVKSTFFLYGNEKTSRIDLRPPYDGLTEEGIGINSELSSVIEAYGQPDEIDAEQGLYKYGSGIIFYLSEDQKTVAAMTIF